MCDHDDNLIDDGPSEAERHRRATVFANWGVSIIAHAVVLMLLAAVILAEPMPPERAPIRVVTLDLEAPDEPDPPERELLEPVEVDVAADAAAPEAISDTSLSTALDIADFELDDPAVSNQREMPTLMAIGSGASGGGDGGGAFGGGGGGPGGTGDGIGFFDTHSDVSGRILFIIDMSKSLEEEQQFLIKHRLAETLVGLTRYDRFSVLFFSGPTWLMGEDPSAVAKRWQKGGDWHDYLSLDPLPEPVWRLYSPSVRRSTEAYLDQLQTTGGTDWRHPFAVAYAMDPQPDLMFFLTDGKVNNAEQTVALVERNTHIPVQTIGFGLDDEDGIEALKRIAEITDGMNVAYTMDEIHEMYQRLINGGVQRSRDPIVSQR